MKYKIPNEAEKFESEAELFRMRREKHPDITALFNQFRHEKRGGFLAVTYYQSGNLEYLGFIGQKEQANDPFISLNEAGNEGYYQIGFINGSFKNGVKTTCANGFEEGPDKEEAIETNSFIKNSIQDVLKAFKSIKKITDIDIALYEKENKKYLADPWKLETRKENRKKKKKKK